eukprot:11411469-Alexandrium_andersonii.AAC.1
MPRRVAAQDCRAERRRVNGCMGREVRAVGAPPLQYRVVMGSLIPRRQALVAAPKAHALQDLRGRAGPPRGLAD